MADNPYKSVPVLLSLNGQEPRLLQVTTVKTTLEAFLLPWAEHFRNMGWRVAAACSEAGGTEILNRSFDAVYSVPWSRNPLKFWQILVAAKRIRAVCAAEKPNIVHVHTPVAAFITRLALRKVRASSRLRVICTAHGFHFYRDAGHIRNRWALAIEKLAGRWTDYLIVINGEDEEMVKRHRIVQEQRVVRMRGIGVDSAHYDKAKVEATAVTCFRQEIGLGDGDQLFTMVAEFQPGKRHRDALLALAQGPHNVHLALAGKGPLRAEMERLAKKLSIGQRVHFLGQRQDIATIMRASVATLLPSEREGLPRCVMESLCLEIPVVGTDVRGTRELLQGGCGLLVPIHDPGAIAKAIGYVLAHPEECAAMGRRGRSKMAEYDVRQILRLHEDLYLQAIRT